MTSKTSVNLSLEQREVVILGTEYAGEMKKGIFTLMNYLMPKVGLLAMHCSATTDRETGDHPSCWVCREPERQRCRPILSVCSSATTSIAGPTLAFSTWRVDVMRKRMT